MSYLVNQAKKIKGLITKFWHIATPVEVEKKELIFYVNYLQEGMIIFDVGAHIGMLSLLFSRLVGSCGQVHAFEASSVTFTKLSSIAEMAGYPQLTLNHLAVSDSEKIVQLNVYSEEYSSWNSLAERPLEKYGINIKPVNIEDVQAITIDRYCRDNKVEFIDLLKIDVEGAEYQVMLGAKSMFKNKRIRCCVFEFGATTFDMGNSPKEIESFLNSYDYSVSNIVKGNPNFPGRDNALSARFSVHVAKPN
jgi:FkbM family methyltransferase